MLHPACVEGLGKYIYIFTYSIHILSTGTQYKKGSLLGVLADMLDCNIVSES